MQSTSIRPHRSSWDLLHPLLDALGIYGALWGIQSLAGGWFDEAASQMGLVAVITFLVVGQFTGLYRSWRGVSPDSEVLSIVVTWLASLLVLAGLAFLTRQGQDFARSAMLGWAVLAPCMVALLRMHLRIAHRLLLARGVGTRRVAIAGLNELGLQTARNLQEDPGLGLRLEGFFDDRAPVRLPASSAPVPALAGNLSELVAAARENKIDVVLVTLPMRAESRIRYLLSQLSDTTCSVYIVPDFFVFELLHSRWANLGGLPAVSVFENPLYGVDGLLKRATDIALAMIALAVAAVPMLAIAVAVKLTSPGPVFFRQRRYGLDGREIRVWKFRSMRVCEDGAVVRQATQEDPRITRLGGLLRKTSLDELPQLINVLEGTMSLVGPRPHANAHNEQYRRLIRGYMLRHKVKPGITGLAQVQGCRGETDTVEKMQRRVEYDHRYIREWSLWLDLKILARTLLVAWRQPEAH